MSQLAELLPAAEAQPQVLFQDNPFSSRVAYTTATEGATISTLFEGVNIRPGLRPYVRAWVDDREVPAELWDDVTVRDGQTVYLRVVPQGKSGKDILRTILLIVVVIVAWYYAPYIAGTGAAGASVGGMTLGAQIGTALVAAGITAVGFMAVNALIPPPKLGNADNQNSDPRYSLTGTQNRFAPYADIPRVFGERRVFPLHGARPYSEIQGDDEYLRLVLVVGWGPLDISNIRIGNTPITAYSNIEYEVREGWDTDPPLTLFTRTVKEEGVSVAMEPYQAPGYYLSGPGPYPALNANGDWFDLIPNYDNPNPPQYGDRVVTYTNDWHTRTTDVDAIEFSVDIAFPQGLFVFDDEGRRHPVTVVIEVDYRPVGGNWVDVIWEERTTDPATFGTNGQIIVTESSTSAVRVSGRMVLPAKGQYEVRMRRLTGTGTTQQVDMVWWTAIRTIKEDYPVNQSGLAMIALRLKASGQLNGVPSAINVIAKSYLPTWNGSAWSWAITSNPAWAATDLLRRRNGGTYLPDSRIDLAAFKSWADACDATAPNAAEKRWSFNHVFEGGGVMSSLRFLMAASRAHPTKRDGKHSVIRDLPQSVPKQHISPRNSWGYSGSKAFFERPHAFRVLFPNASKEWAQDEILVYDDGYSEGNAELFETLELPGVTSPTLAWREGRYHMAVARLRPETHMVSMDVEALGCSVGDLVLLHHDAIGVGILGTRVAGVTLSAGLVRYVQLEDEVYYEAATGYVLRVRQPDGSSVLCPLVNDGAGYRTTVELQTPLAPAAGPAAGDLAIFGETNLETVRAIVRKIEPGPDLSVELTLVDEAAAVHSADTGTIPPFDSKITLPNLPGAADVPPVYISVLRSGDSAAVIGDDGTVHNRIYVELQQPYSNAEERVASFILQFKRSDERVWREVRLERQQPYYYVDQVYGGEIWQFRSRGVAESGAESSWSTIVSHTVVKKSFFEQGPTNLAADPIPGGISLTWDNPAALDLAGIDIYEHTADDSGAATLLTSILTNRYDRMGLSPADGTRYYWLKARDTSGNESDFAGPIATSADDLTASARTINLTVDVQAITYDENAANPSPTGVTITATALSTVGTPYYEFLVEGVSQQNTISNTFAYTPQADGADMPELIEVRLRENGAAGDVLATDQISIFALIAGRGAPVIVLSNRVHAIACDSAGVPKGYAGAGTDIRVWSGTTPLTYGTGANTFSVTVNTATNITPGAATTVTSAVANDTRRYAEPSNMTADEAELYFNVTVNIFVPAFGSTVSATFPAVQRFTKVLDGADGENAVRYYIKPLTGPIIKNGVGQITIEAHAVNGPADVALSSGSIRLYDPSNNIVNTANGYATGSNGYTGVLDAGDINGSKVITLKDGPSGTPLDTITVVDSLDGEDAGVIGFAYANPLAWRQDRHDGAWAPSTTTSDVVFEFYFAGAMIATETWRVTRTADGDLSAARVSGDAPNITVAVSGGGTGSITLTGTYSDGVYTFTVSETLIAVRGGLAGADGEAGLPGATTDLRYDDANLTSVGGAGSYVFSNSAGLTGSFSWAFITGGGVTHIHLNNLDQNNVDVSDYLEAVGSPDHITWYKDSGKWVEFRVISHTDNGTYQTYQVELVEFKETTDQSDISGTHGVGIHWLFNGRAYWEQVVGANRPADNATANAQFEGSGIPASGLGVSGDSYRDTVTGNYYLKGPGGWSLIQAHRIYQQGDLATSDQADWATQVTGASRPEDYAGANVPDLGGLVYNSAFRLRDLERARPVGWYLAATSVAGALQYNGDYAWLRSDQGDSSVDMTSTAFQVNPNMRLKVKVRLRGDVAGSGMLIQVAEYDADLPEGNLFVARSTQMPTYDNAFGQYRTRAISLVSTSVGTGFADYEATYQPTSSARWASLVIIANGSPNLRVARATVEPDPGALAASDLVTQALIQDGAAVAGVHANYYDDSTFNNIPPATISGTANEIGVPTFQTPADLTDTLITLDFTFGVRCNMTYTGDTADDIAKYVQLFWKLYNSGVTGTANDPTTSLYLRCVKSALGAGNIYQGFGYFHLSLPLDVSLLTPSTNYTLGIKIRYNGADSNLVPNPIQLSHRGGRAIILNKSKPVVTGGWSM